MPNYQITLHRDAKTTLSGFTAERRDRITDIITEVSERRKPTDHPKCKVLNNNHPETLYKVRVGDYRVLCQLNKPELQVLKIGERNGFYNDSEKIYEGL
jgi:mRNA-degrading endonuclease RelE of RelBE toxin-antitoxin system